MEQRNFETKLGRYMDAGFPVLYIHTFEEEKVESIIQKISNGKDLKGWNEIKGHYNLDTNCSTGMATTLEDTLNIYAEDAMLDNNVLVLKDCHEYLENSQIASKIKGIAKIILQKQLDACIIIISNIFVIPKELEKYITVLEMDYLSVEEIKEVILNFIEENELEEISTDLTEEFSQAFKGLTEFEVINLLCLAYAGDGTLSKKDLDLIFDQKQQMIKKSGILDMIPLKESIEDIGGLENLKEWFSRKSKIYNHIEKAQKFGVDMPKGVLIAGVPGCGKTLNAKAAAHLFNVPLLRLDMGRLMGKYVGESEANLRNAIALAEAISPCVLWIDELEKAFAGIGGSGGGSDVTTRLFGNFLTWMQEKESPTFVVTTANNITNLPPELLRKGRFDEIFYVGLPTKAERKKIFEIHIKKRRPNDLSNIDIDKLVKKSEGYTGADIEGVIKDAIENVFSDGETFLTTDNIESVMSDTHSLSELMKEDIENMIKEYEKRKFRNASKK